MRETGQNGELGHRPSRTVQPGILLAAAEQSEKVHDVRTVLLQKPAAATLRLPELAEVSA